MPARMDNYFLSEVLRHFWRGVGQFWGGGETVVHSFLFMFWVNLKNDLAIIKGAA